MEGQQRLDLRSSKSPGGPHVGAVVCLRVVRLPGLTGGSLSSALSPVSELALPAGSHCRGVEVLDLNWKAETSLCPLTR